MAKKNAKEKELQESTLKKVENVNNFISKTKKKRKNERKKIAELENNINIRAIKRHSEKHDKSITAKIKLKHAESVIQYAKLLVEDFTLIEADLVKLKTDYEDTKTKYDQLKKVQLKMITKIKREYSKRAAGCEPSIYFYNTNKESSSPFLSKFSQII